MNTEDILEWYNNLDLEKGNEEEKDEAIVVSYSSSEQEQKKEEPDPNQDNVSQRDEKIVQEAHRLMKIIEEKLKEYAQYSGVEYQYYMEKNQTAKEIKDVSNQLSQLIGEL